MEIAKLRQLSLPPGRQPRRTAGSSLEGPAGAAAKGRRTFQRGACGYEEMPMGLLTISQAFISNPGRAVFYIDDPAFLKSVF